jgi:ferredoxin-NADP reductase
MLRPTLHIATIKNTQQVTWKVTKLVLTLINPSDMEFTPGQFINLKCPNNHYRAYSISSDYKIKNEIYILVETGHKGIGSDYVKSLKVGDQVEFIGPSGRFSLLEPVPDDLRFYATGTGITPFIAMFHRLVDINYKGKVEVFFGIRHEKEILEETNLRMFVANLPDFSYHFYVSQPELNGKGQTVIKGHITDALNDFKNISKTARYYVCGHPSMVDEVENTLVLNGVELDDIIVEEFTHSHS